MMSAKLVRPNRFGDDALVIVGLMLLVAFRFAFTIADHRLYGPFNDNVFMLGPMFAETARLALHGIFPYYLPSFGTGFPLFESPHYSVCYPFYFFGVLDYGGPLQSLYTLTYLSIFHRFVFAVNLYVMLRCARISPWAAFAAASIGVIARNTELYATWLTMTASYTWMPLIIAGAILLLRFPGQFWGILLLGGSAGLLTLATAAQPVSHALLFCVVFFGALMTWLILRRDSTALVRLILSLLAAGAIAFGLAAVSAIPVLMGIEHMIRHIGGGSVLGNQALPWDKFSPNDLQLRLAELSGILIKPIWINVVGSPYVGPIGVVGAASALLYYRRLDVIQRFLVCVIGGIGLYGLLSACGTNLGFAYLNYYLPFINKSREPGRHLVLFLFAVVFLTGLGLDQIGRLITDRKLNWKEEWRIWLPVSVLPVMAIAVVTWELLTNAPLAHGGWLVLLLAPSILLLGRLFRTPSTRIIALGAILASTASAISPTRTFGLSASDSIDFAGRSSIEIQRYVDPVNLRSLEVLSVIREKVGPGDFRIDFRDPERVSSFWGMNASYYGFDSFYNRLTPQPYDQYRFAARGNTPYLRAMMGARYVLCGAQDKPTDPGAKELFDVRGYKLFENAMYMNRLTLVHSLAGMVRDEDQFIAEAARGYNFLTSVYIQEKDAEHLKNFLPKKFVETTAENDKLQLVENSVNRVAVVAESSRPGLLVINEWFLPAWKAKVNGKSRQIVRANQFQIGVALRPGKNVIEFTYRPSVFSALLILNRATWLVLASLTMVCALRSVRLSSQSK